MKLSFVLPKHAAYDYCKLHLSAGIAVILCDNILTLLWSRDPFVLHRPMLSIDVCGLRARVLLRL